uniref:F-box associated domain-containing protein n=1 Tax=Tanacetum cinerariifolium TaxID=118510 RepID=A0A699Q9P4_TANCI|nr:hypothetical protein [Tanacetum cinerariifolium]
MVVSNQPFLLMKVHGLLGVVCYDREAASSEMQIWLLKDYEKRVWVRESVGFCKSWVLLRGPFLLNPYFRKNVPVPMYGMERRSVELVEYALHDLFLHSDNRFDHVSIFPIRRNGSRTLQAG